MKPQVSGWKKKISLKPPTTQQVIMFFVVFFLGNKILEESLFWCSKGKQKQKTTYWLTIWGRTMRSKFFSNDFIITHHQSSKVPRHKALHKIQASPQSMEIGNSWVEDPRTKSTGFSLKNDMRSVREMSWVIWIPLLAKLNHSIQVATDSKASHFCPA